jgi:hypothetical protein
MSEADKVPTPPELAAKDAAQPLATPEDTEDTEGLKGGNVLVRGSKDGS